MQEWAHMEAAYARAQRAGLGAVLVTVVATEGSTYRKAGARMLLTPGETVGVVSGGCLEDAVRERACAVLAAGRAETMHFDLTDPDDALLGYGKGCPGRLTLFLEPLPACLGASAWWRAWQGQDRDEPWCELKALAPGGPHGPHVGETVLMDAAGRVRASYGNDGRPGARAGEPAWPALLPPVGSRPGLVHAADGQPFFAAWLPPVPRLVVVAQHDDALPMLELGRRLGWHTTLLTRHEGLAEAARSRVDDVAMVAWEDVGARIRHPRHTAVVVMTHRFLADMAVLASVAALPLSYCGVMGAAQRAALVRGELTAMGLGEFAAFVTSPIGSWQATGGPEEIALSCVAEIQSRRARASATPAATLGKDPSRRHAAWNSLSSS